LKGGGRGRG